MKMFFRGCVKSKRNYSLIVALFFILKFPKKVKKCKETNLSNSFYTKMQNYEKKDTKV